METTALTLISVQRILAIATGAFLCYLGYRLFLNVPTKEDGEGKFTLPGGIAIHLTRIGPGVFFSLFGTIIMIVFFQSPMQYKELITEIRNADTLARQVQKTDTTVHQANNSSTRSADTGALMTNAGNTIIKKETYLVGATPKVPTQETPRATGSRSTVQQDIRSMNQLALVIARDSSLNPIKRSTHLTMIDNLKCSMMETVWAPDWGSFIDFRDRINGNKSKPLNQNAYQYFNSGKETP